MKNLMLCFLSLATAIPLLGKAAEGWLLVSQDGRQSLVYGTPSGFHAVASLGDITVYDNSGPKIGLLTRDNALRSGSLHIVDKETRRIEVTWPVHVFPASQLLGPSEDLLLLGSHAYFVSVRFDRDGQSIQPNKLGGYFDLTRVSIELGDVESYPMPREVTNPRITGIEEQLVVYSSKGGFMWTFDEATRSVELIGGKVRANLGAIQKADGIPDPADTLTASAIPGTLATLKDESRVFVDQASIVYRVSKNGEAEALWNLGTLLPGITPSLVRIIELR